MECGKNAISLKGFSIHLPNVKNDENSVQEKNVRDCIRDSYMENTFFKYTRRLQWKSYVLVIIIRNNDVIIIFKRIFHPVSLSMSHRKIPPTPF